MIFTKFEISPGIELKVNVDPDELYTICPQCGSEHQVDYAVIEALEGCWTGTVTCGKPECNEKAAAGETADSKIFLNLNGVTLGHFPITAGNINIPSENQLELAAGEELISDSVVGNSRVTVTNKRIIASLREEV